MRLLRISTVETKQKPNNTVGAGFKPAHLQKNQEQRHINPISGDERAGFKPAPTKQCGTGSSSGVSMVEVLISLGLMAVLAVACNVFIVGTSSQINYMEKHSKSTLEVEHAFGDLRTWLNNGSRIDSQSTNQKLILDTLDENNNVVRVIYQIVASGGYNVLQVSYDNGVTWITPYMTGSSSAYQVVTGEFLYCGYQNNCTRFTTAGGAGTLVPPGNAAFAPAGSTVLASPDKATKVVLYQFQFSRTTSAPQPTRTISDTFIRVGQPLISYVADDFQYFDMSNLPGHVAGNTVSLVYDALQQRLLITDFSQVIISNRTGQKLSYGSASTYPSPVTYAGGFTVQYIALENDGTTALLLWKNTPTNNMDRIYILNLNTGTFTGPIYDFDTMGFISSGSVAGMAYDPGTPNDLYIVAFDTTTNKFRIYERKISNGSASTASPNVWDLPTALATGNPNGLTIDPATGDFYIALPTSSSTLAIYHIARSSPTTDDHFNISFSGSSISSTTSNIPAVSTSGNWFGLSYDPQSNHLFLLDYNLQRVFEIIPPRLMSPRS